MFYKRMDPVFRYNLGGPASNNNHKISKSASSSLAHYTSCKSSYLTKYFNKYSLALTPSCYTSCLLYGLFYLHYGLCYLLTNKHYLCALVYNFKSPNQADKMVTRYELFHQAISTKRKLSSAAVLCLWFSWIWSNMNSGPEDSWIRLRIWERSFFHFPKNSIAGPVYICESPFPKVQLMSQKSQQ